MGFSRQEYWSGLLFPPPGDLPDPGIEPTSPGSPALQMDSLPLSHLVRMFAYYTQFQIWNMSGNPLEPNYKACIIPKLPLRSRKTILHMKFHKQWMFIKYLKEGQIRIPSHQYIQRVSIHSSFSRFWHFATPWTVAHRLLCPWDSPGKHTGVGSHALLQGMVPTWGSNLSLRWLLHCRWILYTLSQLGSPICPE